MKLTKGKVISALLALLLVLLALFPISATSESGTEEQAAIEITIPDEEPPEEPEAIQIELDANDDEPAQEEIPEIEVSIEESNVASRRLFEKMGFVLASKEDDLILYIYQK